MRTWQECYVGQISQDFLDGLKIDESTAAWEERAERIAEWPCPDLLVLDDDGAVIGFAGVGASRDQGASPTTGELQGIYLRREHWGQGKGSQLLVASVARLREIGYRLATLWVLESNIRARQFYESRGWNPDGEQKREILGGESVTELRYSLQLAET